MLDIYSTEEIDRVIGVSKNKGNNYYVAYYYENYEKYTVGYYYTQFQARIAREHAVRSTNIKNKHADSRFYSVTSEELEYAVHEIDKLKATQRLSRIKGFSLYKGRYVPYMKKRGDLGYRSYNTKVKALIVRNVSIINNKVNASLSDIGMSIEEQTKAYENIINGRIEEQQARQRERLKEGHQYRGVSKVHSKTIKQVIYASRISINKKTLLIGCSLSEINTAIMYNIIVSDNGIDRRLNYVNMTIEEQKEYLIKQGFTYDRDNKKFYKYNKKRGEA